MSSKIKEKFHLVHHQLNILLWKNFQVQRRRPISYLIEILLPVLLMLLLVWIRAEYNSCCVYMMGPYYFYPLPLTRLGNKMTMMIFIFSPR
jgi:tryptophan-rich sensory protein